MATRESFDKSGNPSYLQPNRKADQEDRVKKDPVVSGKVKKKDKPVHKKLSEAVFAEDVKEVKSYLLWDVLIPALKDTVSDLGKRGIDAMLYGSGKSPNVERHGNASYRKYQAASERRNTRSTARYNRRAAFDFEDIVLEDRRDAEAVLEHLIDYTVEYEMASVADFYELVDFPTTYIDNKYGWNDLRSARVLRVRDGYILDLPKPEALEG